MAAALDTCRGNDSSAWLARTPRLEDPTNANQEGIGDSMHFGSQVGGPLDSRSRGPAEPFQGLDASPVSSPRSTGGVCTETRGSVIEILPLATMADPGELPIQVRGNRTRSPKSGSDGRAGISVGARILGPRSSLVWLGRHVAGPIIEALFPADCPGCARPLPGINRYGLCDGCWARVEPVRSPLCPLCGISFPAPLTPGHSSDHPCGRCNRHPPVFDGARSALVFDGPVRSLLHLFKFDKRSDLARPLANAILGAIPDASRFDLVVPVPLHWTRAFARGYNQSALLARRISRAIGIPCRGRLLIKRRRTPDQTHLDAPQRRRNLRGAFAIRRGPRLGRRLPRRWLAGARILLVDDVLTTGATADECARVLKAAGAAHVFVVAVARTPLPGRAASPQDHPSGTRSLQEP